MDRDPQLDERVQAFLAGRPRPPKQETEPKALQTQINGLADMLTLVVRERDQYIAAATSADAAKMWARILTAAVIGEMALIGFLANQLFSRLK